MQRHLIVCACLLVFFAALQSPAQSQSGIAEGPVILTIIGKISKPNRGSMDAFKDPFFKSQDVAFEKATAFDRRALLKLGTKKMQLKLPEWSTRHEFEGPLLRDVLNAAGAEGKTLFLKALDGYGIEIPLNDVRENEIIIALNMDGKALGLGGRGPAWLLYPERDGSQIEESKLIWSLYLVEVK